MKDLDWEKQFDEMTGLEMVGNAETYTKHTDPLEVKGFIRLLLARQKEEMEQEVFGEAREKVEGMRLKFSEDANMWYRSGTRALYTNSNEIAERENKAIDNILATLKGPNEN